MSSSSWLAGPHGGVTQIFTTSWYSRRFVRCIIVVVASHCAPASSLRRSLLLLDAPHARALALPVAASGGLTHRRPCPP